VNEEFPAIVHMALGRPPTRPVWLPDVAQHVVDAVVNWIRQSYHSSRRPVAAARILVLAVELHLNNQPWPTRKQAMAHLGIASVPTFDRAISQCKRRAYLTDVSDTVPGNIARADTSKTLTYMVPSDELIAVVTAAR
jgi:hypothetical protein